MTGRARHRQLRLGDEEGERLALESLRARRVDALVLSLVNDRDPNIGAFLQSIRQPIVLIDREVKGVSADVVLTDERNGSRDAMEHLAALGHTTVGFATISTSVRPGRESLAGYQTAVARPIPLPPPVTTATLPSSGSSSFVIQTSSRRASECSGDRRGAIPADADAGCGFP